VSGPRICVGRHQSAYITLATTLANMFGPIFFIPALIQSKGPSNNQNSGSHDFHPKSIADAALGEAGQQLGA
jgi:hypothetical protein